MAIGQGEELPPSSAPIRYPRSAGASAASLGLPTSGDTGTGGSGSGMPSVGVEVIAFETEAKHNVAPAAGGPHTVTVQLDPVGLEEFVLVDRIVVSSTSGLNTEVRCFITDTTDANEVEFTPAGNHDVFDAAQPILVPGGAPFIVQWTNVDNGDTCVARVQYRRCRMVRE